MTTVQVTSTTRSSQQHIYKPLAVGEIRLVHLQPGDLQDPVQLTLHHVACNSDMPESQPVYEALSYTWGSSDFSRTVCVDRAVEFSVTDNLYDCLRRLRLPSTERFLWIDAICINQLDLTEKATQISFMGRIFSSASQVLIWLGEPFPSSGIDTYVYISKALERVLDNTSKRWWERVWTFQEFALSQKAVFCFGNNHLEQAEFFSLLTGYRLRYAGDELSPLKNARHDSPVHAAFAHRARCRERILATKGQSHCSGTLSLFDLCEATASTRATRLEDHVYALLGVLHPAYRDYVTVSYRQAHNVTFMQLVFAAIDISRSLEILALVPFVRLEGLDSTRLPSWVLPFHTLHVRQHTELQSWGGNAIELSSVLGEEFELGVAIRTLMCEEARGSCEVFECSVDYGHASLRVSGCICDRIRYSVRLSTLRPMDDREWQVSMTANIQEENAYWRATSTKYCYPESSPAKTPCGSTLCELKLAVAGLQTHYAKRHLRETSGSRIGRYASAISSLLRELLYGSSRDQVVDYPARVADPAFIDMRLHKYWSCFNQDRTVNQDRTEILLSWLHYFDYSSETPTLFITERNVIGIGNGSVKVGDSLAMLQSMKAPAVLRSSNHITQSPSSRDQQNRKNEAGEENRLAGNYTFQGFAYIAGLDGTIGGNHVHDYERIKLC